MYHRGQSFGLSRALTIIGNSLATKYKCGQLLYKVVRIGSLRNSLQKNKSSKFSAKIYLNFVYFTFHYFVFISWLSRCAPCISRLRLACLWAGCPLGANRGTILIWLCRPRVLVLIRFLGMANLSLLTVVLPWELWVLAGAWMVMIVLECVVTYPAVN